MAVNRFYKWLGQQDWCKLNERHYCYQLTNDCIIRFDTYAYWLWLGAKPDDLDGVPELFYRDRNVKKPRDVFNESRDDILEMAKLGVTKSSDIGKAVDVPHQTIAAWIKKGWLPGGETGQFTR